MHKEHEDVVNVKKGEVIILNLFYALLYVKKILLACTKNKFGFFCVFQAHMIQVVFEVNMPNTCLDIQWSKHASCTFASASLEKIMMCHVEKSKAILQNILHHAIQRYFPWSTLELVINKIKKRLEYFRIIQKSNTCLNTMTPLINKRDPLPF